MYELIVIWTSGEKEIHEFQSREQACETGDGYKMAFGTQIEWVGVREKR